MKIPSPSLSFRFVKEDTWDLRAPFSLLAICQLVPNSSLLIMCGTEALGCKGSPTGLNGSTVITYDVALNVTITPSSEIIDKIQVPVVGNFTIACVSTNNS